MVKRKKKTKFLRLNNMILKNQGVIKETKGKIKNYLEIMKTEL